MTPACFFPWPRLTAGLVLALTVASAEPVEPPQEHFALRAWETDNGLPHNVVKSILQRRDGFLWAMTSGGLVRFDGVQFDAFRSPLLDDAKSFPLRALIEENARTILIAADGARLLRLTDGAFSPHPLMAEFQTRKIQALFREAEDVFWVAFTNKEVWRWQRGAVERFPLPAEHASAAWEISFAQDSSGVVFMSRGAGLEQYEAGRLNVLPGALPRPIVGSSRTGGVWIANGRRLARVIEGKITSVADPAPWRSATPPSALLESQDGALWVAVPGAGLRRWTPEKTMELPTSHPKVDGLIEDDQGNIWAATGGGGLDCLQPAKFSVFAEDASWTNDVGGSVCEDAQGVIWFSNSRGVRKITGDRVEVLNLPDWTRRASVVCPDRAGNIWMAVGNRLSRFEGGKESAQIPVESSSSSDIRVLFAARDGSVWAGRTRGPLERYREGRQELFGRETGFTEGNVQAIAEDEKGGLWVGTFAGELFALSNGRWVQYGEWAGLPGRGIRAIHCDREGVLWVGTTGGGVLVRRDGRFARITENEGLISNVVSQILEDDSGRLWFGSSRGIFSALKAELLDCVAGRKAAITPIMHGRSEGLPTGISVVGSYQPTAWKTHDGKLWFVTRKGLVTTDPAHHRTNHPPPRVSLEHFVVDGHAIESASARLPSSARRFEFRFTAPALQAPENLRFRYRLDGLDANWSEASAQRMALYPTALPPGSYRFRVTACSSDQVWNPEEAVCAFEIVPLWWETWWARSAAGLAALAGLVVAVRYGSHRRLKAQLEHLRQKQRLDAERTRIARDLHDDLGASLTQVSLMADELSEDSATVADLPGQSAKLAERVRGIARDLDAVVWAVSPKNDRLSSFCSYLGGFAEEFFRPTTMTCRVSTEGTIPPALLSPETRHHLFMIAKELMNNALKHSRATQIEIMMRMSASGFELTVADDGCGFSPTATATDRNGLRNLQTRAAECGATVTFQSPERGTAVRVLLPLTDGESKPPI